MDPVIIEIVDEPIFIELADSFGNAGTNGWSLVPALVADGEREVIQVADWTGGTGVKPATGGYVGATGIVNNIALAVDVKGDPGPAGTPGDRYATTSTTSITVPNPNQQVTMTVGTGLAYTPQQEVIVANDGIAYFNATVNSYNAGTGVMLLTCTKKHGSGTFATWTVNISGAVGAAGDNGWSPVFAAASDGERRVLQVVDWQGGTGTKPATGLYVGASGLVPNIANGVDIRGPQGTPALQPWQDPLTFINNPYFATHFLEGNAGTQNTSTGVGFFSTSTEARSALFNVVITDLGVAARGAGYMEMSVAATGNSMTVARVGRGGSAIASYLASLGAITLECAILWPLLPDGTNDFAWRFGLTTSTANLQNAAYVEMSRVDSVVRWRLITVLANVATTQTNLVIAVAANTHYRVRLVFTPTSVTATVNGVTVATSISNIPAGALLPFYQMAKIASSATRVAYCDYHIEHQALNTPYL